MSMVVFLALLPFLGADNAQSLAIQNQGALGGW
ncbi:hypothetical protein BJY24_001524 [Nocardia transvalensis]|uniref:Uncharacterized protein n=1 Tax=Nocardia transvalensis TaxID=37333 RepID=A0A7W9PAW3_9NOCA|nr:hypothetical protein [Nocardia transvalensis]